MIKRDDVIRLNTTFRVLSGIILFVAILASIIVIVVLITQEFDVRLLFFILVFILPVHVAWSITFSFFAPAYLLFAHK